MTPTLKIYGEHTRATDGPSLCESCAGAMIVRGTRMGDDVTICRRGLGYVRFVVTSCNAYHDAALLHAGDFEETAWVWFPDLRRFVSPAELRRLQPAAFPTSATSAPTGVNNA